MTAIDPRYPSILHALVAQAERGSDGPVMTLIAEPGQPRPRRHDAVLEAAARGAAYLAERGVGRGDRVLLVLPTGWEFVTALFGAQLLGAIPTAIGVTIGLGGAAGVEAQLKELVGYLRPAAIITVAALVELGAGIAADAGTVLVDGADLLARATAADAPAHPIRRPAGDDLALIQCTSGSTGRPKGVMISHANLAANLEQIVAESAWTVEDTSVSWLPLYHDMGLINGMLCAVFAGGDGVLMPPTRFLRAPADWLRHLTTYRGTIAAAPNFAYGYAAARVRDEELEGVDLSAWRIMVCGGEPIHPPTVQRFVDRFAPWGARPDGLKPSYGMAEAALAISAVHRDDAMRFDTIDRQAAVVEGKVIDVDPDTPGALQVVECGRPMPGTEVRIVAGDGNPLGENEIGHIQFRGPSRTLGYFNLPEETAAAIDAPDWWKTGDVGYRRDGRLRITGRAKDLIIIRGANYFPSDFELAVETVPGVRLGSVAAVGYRPENADSEELHLIVETELEPERHDALRRSISSAVSSRTGVVAAAIHLVPKRSIPKTTSGKIQRSKARQLFVENPAAASSR